MDKRICIKCNKEKSLEEFHFKSKAKGTRKMTCRDCCHVYGKKHYDSNRKKYIGRAREYRPLIRRRNRLFLIRYLRVHPCIDCGEGNIIVLEFDHVKGKKRYVIANMVQGNGLKTIMKEIEKCEVRCGNCHKKRHATKKGSNHWVNGDLGVTEEELQNIGHSSVKEIKKALISGP